MEIDEDTTRTEKCLSPTRCTPLDFAYGKERRENPTKSPRLLPAEVLARPRPQRTIYDPNDIAGHNMANSAALRATPVRACSLSR